MKTETNAADIRPPTLCPKTSVALQSETLQVRIDAVDHMQNAALSENRAQPFHAGAMVVLTLAGPREKFWGAVLAMAPEGLTLRGIDLASFEDLLNLLREGEPFTSGVVFFPMHRVERMELDLPDGAIPSLSQRFANKTGMDPAQLLCSLSDSVSGGQG